MSRDLISPKKMIISFLILSFGLLAAFMSPTNEMNFWNKLLEMITNKWVTIMLLVAIVNATTYLNSDERKNANFLIRFQNLSSFFKKNIDQIWKIVLIFILYIMFVSFFGSFIFCGHNNIENINYLYYNIPMWLYILFYVFKLYFFMLGMGILTYLLQFKFSNYIIVILLMVFIAMMLVVEVSTKIDDIYNMPILISNYFKIIEYSTFFLEIFSNLIQLIIMNFVILIIFNYYSNKKWRSKII